MKRTDSHEEEVFNDINVDADGVCHKVKGNFCTESDMVKLSKIQVYDYEEYHDWNWHGLELLENVADMNYLMQARYMLTKSCDTLVLEDNLYIRKAK